MELIWELVTTERKVGGGGNRKGEVGRACALRGDGAVKELGGAPISAASMSSMYSKLGQSANGRQRQHSYGTGVLKRLACGGLLASVTAETMLWDQGRQSDATRARLSRPVGVRSTVRGQASWHESLRMCGSAQRGSGMAMRI